MRTGVLAIACWLLSSPSPAEEQAAAAWDAERWDEASELYGALYAETGNPIHLYARAQAERFAGRCERALPLYERLLDEDVPADAATVDAAHRNIEICKAELPEPVPAPQPVPVVEPAVVTETTPAPARPWHRDPAAGVLVGLGLAGVAVGGGLFGAAAVTSDRARAESDDRSYGEGLERARVQIVAAAVVIGIGGAALATGVVRWAVLARRDRSRAAVVLRGLGVAGRF